MGLTAINATRYGRLLARVLPKVIETDDEFDRMTAWLEDLDFAKRALKPEEEALRELLAKLIQDYDDRRHSLPAMPPRAMLAPSCDHVPFLFSAKTRFSSSVQLSTTLTWLGKPPSLSWIVGERWPAGPPGAPAW